MISCVMITGLKRGFANMPEVAVQCFLDQEYQDCELLILNHGGKNFSGRNVWDIKIKKTDTMHVGQIRNMAFDMAGGEYLATWDDDDWYHPKRLAFQIRHARPGKIQMFKNRIHVDLNSDVSGVWSSRAGGNSTMVFPRDTINRFPNWKKCADVQFANYFGKKEILDNPPEFYVRTIHGKNITDRNIMLAGLKPMDKSQSELVKTIRGLYKAHESGDKQ